MVTKTKSTGINYASSIKKNNIPTQIKFLRFGIRLLDRLSRKLSSKLLLDIFLTPNRRKITDKIQKYYESGHSQMIEFNGKKVFVFERNKEKNNGKRILISHGWGSNSYRMRLMIERLAEENYHVIAYDSPAHGLSEGKRTTMFEVSDLIKELSNMVGSFYAIICHSFGGPTSFLSLDTGLNMDHRFGKPRIICANIPTRIESVTTPFFSILKINDPLKEKFYDRLENLGGRSREEFGISYMHVIDKINNKEIDIDVLLIQDKNDMIIPLTDAQLLHSKLLNSRLKITENLGHGGILRDKRILNEIILDLGNPVKITN